MNEVSSLARKFLYIIAILIVLFLGALFALRIWGTDLSRLALVPSVPVQQFAAKTSADYADASLWIARPGVANDPSAWRPAGVERVQQPGNAAVFLIHPTSYFKRTQWNAPLFDEETDGRTRALLRPIVSIFADVGSAWSPRYRQATLGAFITEGPEGQQALSLAYADVVAAFDAFIAAQEGGTPIILAGHSQGSMHLARLLKERVAGQPVAKRIVAAYVVGWPIPLNADLPALGLPACATADQSGCILSWQSYAEPADYAESMTLFDKLPGLTGRQRTGDRYLCTNPITGSPNVAAAADANPGMLKADVNTTSGEIVRPAVPARCDAKGMLLIGPGPDLGPLVLPNNNYHAYDYALFWQATRADVVRRLTNWRATAP